MLIKLKKLDYDANYTYAPPDVDYLVDSNSIVSVTPIETRRMEKCVNIKLADGEIVACLGTVDEILEKVNP